MTARAPSIRSRRSSSGLVAVENGFHEIAGATVAGCCNISIASCHDIKLEMVAQHRLPGLDRGVRIRNDLLLLSVSSYENAGTEEGIRKPIQDQVMKPRFIPDLHDWLDSFSNRATDEYGADFLPSAQSDGADPVANTPTEITSIPVLASQDLVPTAGPHHLHDSAAPPLQEDNLTSQIPEADAAAPEDGGGAAAANTILTPVTTVLAPAILANPTAVGSIGAHVADVGGAIEVPAHDHVFYSALNSITPASVVTATSAVAADTLASAFAPATTASAANQRQRDPRRLSPTPASVPTAPPRRSCSRRLTRAG